MTPSETTEHTHRIIHFCNDAEQVGIQGGTCADPNCALAAKDAEIAKWAGAYLDIACGQAADRPCPTLDARHMAARRALSESLSARETAVAVRLNRNTVGSGADSENGSSSASNRADETMGGDA